MLLVKHLKHKPWTKNNTHAGSILSFKSCPSHPIILSERPTAGLNGHQHQQNQHQQTATFLVPRTHDVSSEAKSNRHANTEFICPRKSLSKCHWPYLATLCHNSNGGWTYSWGSKKKSDQERENHMATRATSWKDLPCQKWPRVYVFFFEKNGSKSVFCAFFVPVGFWAVCCKEFKCFHMSNFSKDMSKARKRERKKNKSITGSNRNRGMRSSMVRQTIFTLWRRRGRRHSSPANIICSSAWNAGHM